MSVGPGKSTKEESEKKFKLRRTKRNANHSLAIKSGILRVSTVAVLLVCREARDRVAKQKATRAIGVESEHSLRVSTRARHAIVGSFVCQYDMR
jgi:hypothetical protein